MTTLVIMLLGMAAGCFFPAGRKKMNERVQLACTLVLIFSMGVGLSRRDNFFSILSFRSPASIHPPLLLLQSGKHPPFQLGILR